MASITLFVYGTLLRGGAAHEAFCRDATDIRAARVRGRLYRLQEGYPALEVPDDSIRAAASLDAVEDAAVQSSMHSEGTPGKYAGERVYGELITFPDAASALPLLDDYEDCRPGDADSLYQRVLVPAWWEGGCSVAWTYVQHEVLGGVFIPSGRWTD
jgi:gamma-glutamylcyclotransferase (GGCT)/AIG2-like uncharacterized protein YtfP